jgi:uncharacterized membrane protein (TIGR02234 family)
MNSGRVGLVKALAGIAVGGLLVLLASGRVWSTAHVVIPGASAVKLSVTGHAVEPSLPALGIALLALAAGIVAARGRLRAVVAFVVALVGGLCVVVAFVGRSSVSSALRAHELGGAGVPVHGSANGWWVVAALGGLIAFVTGGIAMVRGARWAAMGSKYEVPEARREREVAVDPDQAAWEVLDSGGDPTA